jgi:hypothetical protein
MSANKRGKPRMKRTTGVGEKLVIGIVCLLFGGLAAGLTLFLCPVMDLVLKLLYPVGSPGHTRGGELQWFLACALPGLFAALLLAIARQKSSPDNATGRTIQTWGLTALLGVLIPAAGVLGDGYAGGLLGWYAALVGISVCRLIIVFLNRLD